MSKVISGTELFGKGPMYVPTGVDDGNKYSELISQALERLALHDHSTDGMPAALPRAAEIKFASPVFVVDDLDARFYKCSLILSTPSKAINMTEKNASFYYLPNGAADTITNWIKFSPSYTVDAVDQTKITVRGIPLNNVGLKVIG